ncbi:MAG: HAMP domain-containing sensor histidine kinase, partial [Candidatus Omnitrophica bacterium]|nr:HAMP domain-containing sensor histidine kinase [Candidatus Omnitrophota bacterium]
LSVVEEMKGFMPEKNIKIEAKIEKLPVMEVDPDRVSQILRNLLTNAIKFTPPKGRVDILVKPRDEMILFSVKDNGVGMSQQDQKRLFEPFYQIDNMYQHKSGGTGLGLAISKGIVESQNGKIWLTSQPGKGTIFYFTVPKKPVKDTKAIRLLLFSSEKSEFRIKKIFNTYIGPLGDKEFEDLRNSEGITAESLDKYISSLIASGILQKEKADEFKREALSVLSGDKKEREETKNIEKEVADFFSGK